MRRKDHPSTTESRIAEKALRGLDGQKRAQPPMDGIREAPTTPRENPPLDEGRVARAHEDFHRVLGN
jgi:hypothetical protein